MRRRGGECRLQNKNLSAEFMLRCEACDERFDGKCRGVKEGIIDDEQVWVYSESCFAQLPLRQRKRDVVVSRPKQKYKKRETKEKTLHVDASNKKRSSYNTTAKQQLQLTNQMDGFRLVDSLTIACVFLNHQIEVMLPVPKHPLVSLPPPGHFLPFLYLDPHFLFYPPLPPSSMRSSGTKTRVKSKGLLLHLHPL